MEAKELPRVEREVTSERDPEKGRAASLSLVHGLLASWGESARTLKTLVRSR